MHTRCCEELIKAKASYFSNTGESQIVTVDTTMIETVPALVEFRFDPGNAIPTTGYVFIATGLFDGSDVLYGGLQRAISPAEITASIGIPVLAGGFVQFPGGIGRGIKIINGTDQPYKNLFISIRKLLTLTSPAADISAAK